jgi:hypothetical protein
MAVWQRQKAAGWLLVLLQLLLPLSIIFCRRLIIGGLWAPSHSSRPSLSCYQFPHKAPIPATVWEKTVSGYVAASPLHAPKTRNLHPESPPPHSSASVSGMGRPPATRDLDREVAYIAAGGSDNGKGRDSAGGNGGPTPPLGIPSEPMTSPSPSRRSVTASASWLCSDGEGRGTPITPMSMSRGGSSRRRRQGGKTDHSTARSRRVQALGTSIVSSPSPSPASSASRVRTTGF